MMEDISQGQLCWVSTRALYEDAPSAGRPAVSHAVGSTVTMVVMQLCATPVLLRVEHCANAASQGTPECGQDHTGPRFCK